MIQVTHATFELIRADFARQARGAIPVKGKGERRVWRVLEERAPVAAQAGV